MYRAHIPCGKSFHKEQPFQANDNFPNHFSLLGNKKRSVKEKESSCLSWTLTLNLVLWLWDEVIGLKFSMRYEWASLESILKTWPSVEVYPTINRQPVQVRETVMTSMRSGVQVQYESNKFILGNLHFDFKLLSYTIKPVRRSIIKKALKKGHYQWPLGVLS